MLWLANVLIPGVALIIRCRGWLGFLLSILYGLSANITVASLLIAPEAFPDWFEWLAGLLAVASWLLSQVLLWRLLREAARADSRTGRDATGPIPEDSANTEPGRV